MISSAITGLRRLYYERATVALLYAFRHATAIKMIIFDGF